MRLARTFERSRWNEYEALLRGALDRGYAVVSLEDWVLRDRPEAPSLIARHDVDQHPASALRVAAIEERLGLRSTWYFRWRTADPDVVAAVRDGGFQIGLHYETLTRAAKAAGVIEATPTMVDAARVTLRREIEAFAARFGPIASICAHGDSAIPTVRNLELLDGCEPAAFGVRFDANLALRGQRIGCWLTDRSATGGRWKEGLDPFDLLDRRVSPILLVMHPNNWVGGARLWADRLLSRRSDEPPL